MITLAEYSIEEILPLIGLNKSKIICTVKNKKYKVNTSSLRLECFSRTLKCANCNKEGNIFLLQRQNMDLPPHLNLYYKRDKELILFTKDHQYPKSRGGSDDIDNLQTMCFPCNHAKSDRIIY